MNTNTLLNIYQSYALTKVSELNKQSLVALYAQNEQLSKLNEELTRANRTTEQILRNQIKEIEQKEKRRYYKNMTFNLSQALDLLENEGNDNFRIFASSLFLSPIRDMATDAIHELEEITDKEYAQNIVKRANSLSDNDKAYSGSYKETPWASLLSAQSKIDDIAQQNKDKEKGLSLITIKKEEAHKKKIKKVQEDKKVQEGCLGCLQCVSVLSIVGVFGTIYTHDYDATKGFIIILILAILLLVGAYAEKKSNNKKELNNTKEKREDSEEVIYEKELEDLSNELSTLQQEETRLTTQYNELLQEIITDCPKWENKLNAIAAFIPHDEKKTRANKDSLLTEAAKLVFKKKDASSSLIQRKLAIGYSRAGRILNQLEELGIVGPANGANQRDVLISNELELEKVLESIK